MTDRGFSALLRSPSGGAEWYFIGATFLFAGSAWLSMSWGWLAGMAGFAVGVVLVVAGAVAWSRAAARAGRSRSDPRDQNPRI